MKKTLLNRRPVLNDHVDGVDFIYAQIKIALFNYYYLIRSDLKKRWNTLSKNDRRDAVVVLRYLEDVMKDPAKHFSRTATQNEWNNRAVECMTAKGMKNVADAFYIVHGPREVFIEGVRNATYSPEMYSDLYKLAGHIQNWEYDRTSMRDYMRKQSNKYSDAITKIAKQTQALVDIQEANPLVRPLKQLMNNLQR